MAAQHDDSWRLLTPERPAPPPKLALVPYEHPNSCEGGTTTTMEGTTWWWPAIVYRSFGQAMDERHETLSWETKNRFVRNMYEKHCARRRSYLMTGKTSVVPAEEEEEDTTNNTTMYVAQLLGYHDLWVEFDSTQQKNMLAFVMEALAQREKLPSNIQSVYDLAFEQLKHLLTYDPRTADGSTTIPSIDDILSMGTKSTTTATSKPTDANRNAKCEPKKIEPPPSASSAVIVSSRKRPAPAHDPTRIWGREKHARSMKSSTNVKTTSDTTSHPGPKTKRTKLSDPKSHNSSTRTAKTNPATTTRKKSSVMMNRSATAKRRQIPRLTASQRAQRSRDNFYVFKFLWLRLKEDGWTLVRAGNPLHNWYYIPPAKDGTNSTKDVVKNGIMGVDYFTSTDQVIEWAKRANYRSLVGVTTSDDSSCCGNSNEDETTTLSSHVSGTDADESRAGEDEETLHTNTTDEDDSRRLEDDESASLGFSIPRRRTTTTKSFSQTWKQLRESGWTMVEARKYNPHDDATWYYVRPNIEDISNAIRGRDYFSTPAQLMDWVAANGESVDDEDDFGDAPRDSIMTTPPFPRTTPRDPAKPQLPEASSSDDESENELERFKWNNLWRRIEPFGWKYVSAGKYNKLHDWYYVRPGRTVEQGILGEDYFLTAQDVIAFEMRREGIIQQAAAADKNDDVVPRAQKMRRITLSPAKPIPKSIRKTQWWQLEPIPSFSDVWRVLNLKLGFRYSSGQYWLPTGVRHPEAMNWSLDRDMRTFLCQHGIPNLDSNVLTAEELTELVRWTTFAHVPVKDTNSVRMLQNMQVLKDPMPLLTVVGVVYSAENGYSIPSSSIKNLSLKQLRVHIRGLRDLVTGRRNPKKMLLNDVQHLELRLWAALSPEPLPVFGMNL